MPHKAIISSNILKKAISIVAPAVGSNLATSITSNVLLIVEQNKVSFRATNLMLTYTYRAEIESSDTFTMCLPFDDLKEMCGVLPNNVPVSITFDKNVKFRADGCDHQMGHEDAKDFPAAPLIGGDVLQFLPVLARKMNIAQQFCSTDSLRPAMTGVLFELNEAKINLISTDAHRLFKSAGIPILNADDDLTEIWPKMIVPREAIRMVANMDVSDACPLEISHSDTQIRFRCGASDLMVRLIDQHFPDYRAVMPQDVNTFFRINRAEFAGTLKAVAISSNKTTHQVVFDVSDELEMRAADIDFNKESRKALPLLKKQCNSMKVAVNAKLLDAMVSSMDGTAVEFYISSPTRAMVLSSTDEEGQPASEDYFLIMPLMIGM